MMYNNKFVACLKSYGKILREHGDTVYLPFGTEYSIIMKNLESRKALVETVTIDGDDVLDGNNLIIYPNSEWNLEGFLCGNTIRNRFKFVEKTEQISDFRGDRLDDGLIRLEFRFERQPYTFERINWKPVFCSTCRLLLSECVCPTFISNKSQPRKPRYGSQSEIQYKSASHKISADVSPSSIYCSSHLGGDSFESFNDDKGITVKGSRVDHSLSYATIGNLESERHVIVFRLQGENNQGCQLTKPVFTNVKIKCEYCGTNNPSSHRCCSGCGNHLI